MEPATGDVAKVDVEGSNPFSRSIVSPAIDSGGYVPARNGNQLAQFRELDEAFHGDVDKMRAAMARDDVPATAEAFGSVVRRCPVCHAEFRK